MSELSERVKLSMLDWFFHTERNEGVPHRITPKMYIPKLYGITHLTRRWQWLLRDMLRENRPFLPSRYRRRSNRPV